MQEIRRRLEAAADAGYRDFQAGLLPTLPKERIIGVRTPVLRELAREAQAEGWAEAFMAELPHAYYDEDQLHALLISASRDYERCLAELERFLPFVNNWATCDQLRPQVLRNEPQRTLAFIGKCLASAHAYTVRCGMELLMCYFLGERFQPEYLEWVARDRSEEYYVKMMAAWFFASALALQYEAALPYLEQRLLPEWTHRKAIQKARESLRIPAARKEYLRTLR